MVWWCCCYCCCCCASVVDGYGMGWLGVTLAIHAGWSVTQWTGLIDDGIISCVGTHTRSCLLFFFFFTIDIVLNWCRSWVLHGFSNWLSFPLVLVLFGFFYFAQFVVSFATLTWTACVAITIHPFPLLPSLLPSLSLWHSRFFEPKKPVPFKPSFGVLTWCVYSPCCSCPLRPYPHSYIHGQFRLPNQ